MRAFNVTMFLVFVFSLGWLAAVLFFISVGAVNIGCSESWGITYYCQNRERLTGSVLCPGEMKDFMLEIPVEPEDAGSPNI